LLAFKYFEACHVIWNPITWYPKVQQSRDIWRGASWSSRKMVVKIHRFFLLSVLKWPSFLDSYKPHHKSVEKLSQMSHLYKRIACSLLHSILYLTSFVSFRILLYSTWAILKVTLS
jgi:hypothetical protein